MKIKMFFIAGILACFAAPLAAVAADDPVDGFSPRIRKVYLEPERSVLKKGKFRFLLAGTAGYDNNANLDSERQGDSFFQDYFKASFALPLSEKTDARADYELVHLLYAANSKLDLMSNGARLGLDHKLSQDIVLSTGYSVDMIDYINTGSDDYLDNALDVKVTQQLPHKMFHSLACDVLFRYYDHRYTRTPLAASSDKPRNDWRNTVSYEIGKYFKKDLLKFNVSCFNNNSNDTYLHYYDYNSYKAGASVTHLFNNKLSGLLSYAKQFRDYRTRSLVADPGKTEFERSDLGTAALFYSLNKSVSFGLNYTYRQNYSNEPIDKYSGSIISLSTYYKF